MSVKQFEQDFDNLINQKERIIDLLNKQNKNDLIREYQVWFTEACEVIKQLIPDRISEFKEIYNQRTHYKGIKAIFEEQHFLDLNLEYKIKNRKGLSSYPLVIEYNQELCGKLKNNLERQFAILESAKRKLKSFLMNIKTLTQADLFDSELDMAEELRKKEFLRPAGVLAGVVLESHLKTVLLHKNIDLQKAKSLAQYNELLKKHEIINIPVWRNIQFLIDLRNLCSHKDDKEPTDQNISDLIEGVKKVIKTTVYKP